MYHAQGPRWYMGRHGLGTRYAKPFDIGLMKHRKESAQFNNVVAKAEAAAEARRRREGDVKSGRVAFPHLTAG
jgi:hypothetical protein